MQNYFVFQQMYKYFKKVIDNTDNTVYARYWQSKGLSDGKINAPGTSISNDQAPILEYGSAGIRLKFKGDSLRQNKVTYNHGEIVNIYIVYEISSTFTSQSSFALKNSLFGAVKITKNADISKYKYSEYGICFDSKGSFLHADGIYGVNVIIFGADLSSSTHTNNRANNILVLGKHFIQGINGTTIYAEKMYSTNFTVYGKKVCLSLHYNGDNSYLFVNGRQIVQFKAKVSEIVPYPLCLTNISKDFSISNATGLHGYVYDFSVDYKAIANDKMHDIHRYLMKKKTTLYKMFRIIKKILAIIFLVSNVNSLKCISMKNWECEAREVRINNDYMFYPFSIKVNRCNGNCHNISDPLCVPNVIKTITAKLFDLMSWKNKTKQIKWHESCGCECRLNSIVCNNKQKRNKDKCRCECLINQKCGNKFWNPNIVNVSIEKSSSFIDRRM